jgi:hypothetical protein
MQARWNVYGEEAQGRLLVMWTALLLLCSVEGNCFSFGSPVMQSESQCIQSIPSGLEYARQMFPAYRATDYQCVQWGEGA